MKWYIVVDGKKIYFDTLGNAFQWIWVASTDKEQYVTGPFYVH